MRLKNNSIFLVFCFLALFGCKKQEPDLLIIAAAANMQFVIHELADTFSYQTETPVHVIVGSSGKLTAQIIQGAPFHIFLSADLKYPEELQKKGHTIGNPAVFALGSLVIWSLKNELPLSIDSLTSGMIQRIAIPNPKTAPYGQAAVKLLQDHGIYEAIKHKLIFGESIAQTSQFVTTRAVDLGIVSKSMVMAPELKGKGKWNEAKSEIRIQQSVVMINSKSNMDSTSKKFYNFLFTPGAQEIMTKHGYENTK